MLAAADASTYLLACLVLAVVGNGRPTPVQRDLAHVVALIVTVAAVVALVAG